MPKSQGFSFLTFIIFIQELSSSWEQKAACLTVLLKFIFFFYYYFHTRKMNVQEIISLCFSGACYNGVCVPFCEAKGLISCICNDGKCRYLKPYFFYLHI